MQDGDEHGGESEEHFASDGDGDPGGATLREGLLEREGRAWSGGRGFDESGYGYGAYWASDDG